MSFPADTQLFLHDLSENNNRDWFEANRPRYESEWLRPALDFIKLLGPQLQAVCPTLGYEAKLNGSLLRVYRDTRFSKDKRPYRDHLDMWFWGGAERGWAASGFFARLRPTRLMTGVGLLAFEGEQLASFRAAALDDALGPALVQAIQAAEQAGNSLGAPDLKRVPAGLDPAHPRAALLRHKGMHATWEGPAPESAEAMAALCVERFRGMLPLHAWLAALSSGG